VINPGGYAHTSVAIHDALKILKIPVIEVHLSQVYKREEFRHTLLTAKAAAAIMSGLGKQSYYIAIQSLFD
jgi:3-dehydroquinate dehydratase-2